VIALAALVASTAFAGAFWNRDLGALARELAENRGAPQASLFEDLVRFCNCDALSPLDSPDPLRALLRVEAARRARVVASGTARDTIWRDLLRKDFFRRDPRNPSLANALFWPDEEEMWTGEVRYVEPPRWHCDKPTYAPGSQGDATLVEELRSAGYAEAASRFGYHRATRLLALGARGYAEEQARAVDPAALTDLRHWAALLRIHMGIDPREAAIALARDWHGPDSLPARVLAADHLARAGRWAEIPEIAQDGTGNDPALLEHLRLLQARAFLESGQRDQAIASIPRNSHSATARDLAFEALAGRPIDSNGTEVIHALWPDPAEAYARLATRALLQGAIEAARSAAAALEADGLKGRLVAAELAFAGSDRARFLQLLALLTPSRDLRGSERLARARAVIELANALAVLAPMTPALRPDAAAALDELADGYGGSVARELATVAAVLRTRNAASAGVVPIAAALPLPDLPTFRIKWPEPRSLLAIPDTNGGMRDWFEPDAQLAAGGGAR
jgi:hypothetical protein